MRTPARSVASLALCIGLVAGLAPAAHAEQALKAKLAGAELVAALEQGGYVLLMRHAPTEPVAVDPGLFELANCATQRNLSETGRETARALGAAIAKLRVPIGKVRSSPYCRCLETGRLVFGRATADDLLSVWDTLAVTERSARGGEVRAVLATPPAPGVNTVLITHTGTLLYSFGLKTRPEGIVHVFHPHDGAADYVGSLTPAEWVALADAAPAEPASR